MDLTALLLVGSAGFLAAAGWHAAVLTARDRSRGRTILVAASLLFAVVLALFAWGNALNLVKLESGF